jgi:hypothetical protein
MRIYLVCPLCGSDDLISFPDPEKGQSEIQVQLNIQPYTYKCEICHNQFKPEEAVGMVMDEDGKVRRVED